MWNSYPKQYILAALVALIPDKLKLAKVIPVFKSGDATLPSKQLKGYIHFRRIWQTLTKINGY